MSGLPASDGGLPLGDMDSFTAMLNALATGGDASQFHTVLARCGDCTKQLHGQFWVAPPDAIGPASASSDHNTSLTSDVTAADADAEAEGVELSAMLSSGGLSSGLRGVGEDDSGDGETVPLQGHVEFTDAEISRRKAVWQWFSGLSVDERDRVLTVTDKSWCGFLISLRDTVRKKGSGIFLIDVPDEYSAALDTAIGAGTGTRPRRSSYSGCVWSFPVELQRFEALLLLITWCVLQEITADGCSAQW